MWQPLSSYLGKALNRAGAKRTVEAAIVVENAQALILQMIPELAPRDLEVISLRNGTLTVGVKSSVIGQELMIRSEAIIDALRHAFGEGKIDRLRTRLLSPAETYQ